MKRTFNCFFERSETELEIEYKKAIGVWYNFMKLYLDNNVPFV